jgi:hypothetical protein
MLAPNRPEHFAVLDGEPLALVKPGEYQLRFDYFETAIMFGRAPKLVLKFTIISLGDYFDRVKLSRFYNVTKLLERPQKYGRFKVGRLGAFTREYGRLFHSPNRLDRMAMSEFERHIIVGRARTVTEGADQKRIPEAMQYSVLDELLRIED